MLAFLTKPCLDILSAVVGKDLRFMLIDSVQNKLNDLPPQPFWQIPVFDSTCVSVTRPDGTKRQEERGGIWSYPSDDNHWSLQDLSDVLGDKVCAVELYAPALQQIADGLWKKMNKRRDNTELTEYELGLAPPNQLVLTVKGTYYPKNLPSVGFTATYTLSLSVQNNRLQIQTDTKLDVDDALYEALIFGVALDLLPLLNTAGPFSPIGAAAAQDYLSDKLLDAQSKAASLADMVGVISALIPQQVLLAGKDTNNQAHKLVFPWDDVEVNPFIGIIISWSFTDLVGIYQPRNPSLALLTGGSAHQFPWNPNDPFSNDPQRPGYARVPLYAATTDLRTPYNTILWSVPADYSDVLLVDPDTPHAIMYVLVPPDPPDWSRQVPLTLHIIDADGLDASMTATLTVYYDPNYTPPPPPKPEPPPQPLPEIS